MTLRIGFIGFGEAARAFTASLREAGPVDVSAYDILIHGDGAGPLRQAAERLDVRLTQNASDAIEGADFAFSAVTAGACSDALKLPYGQRTHRHVLFDINSVTAARKAANAELVRASGAQYVDMAVMAPVTPAGHRTPVLVAGDVDGALGFLRDFDFRFEAVGPEAGQATAVKMVRSLFVKGLEAITVQALSAAVASGCGERIMESLDKSYPGLNLREFAGYQFDRIVTHGKRRAEEVREVAQTMRDLGFEAGAALAEGVADVQDAVAAARPRLSPDPMHCAQEVARALSAAPERRGGEGKS